LIFFKILNPKLKERMTIAKTETQRVIETYEAKKTRLQAEISGMNDCYDAINAATVKTAYMQAQLAAYTAKIEEYTDDITEIDALILKLNS